MELCGRELPRRQPRADIISWMDKINTAKKQKVEYTPEPDQGFWKTAIITLIIHIRVNFAADPVFPSYTADPVFPSYTRYMVKTSASPSEGGTVTGGGSYISGMKADTEGVRKGRLYVPRLVWGGKPISTDASLEITVSADRDIGRVPPFLVHAHSW